MSTVNVYETYPLGDGSSSELSNDGCMERAKLPLSNMYRIVGGVALSEEQPFESFKEMAGLSETPEQTWATAA